MTARDRLQALAPFLDTELQVEIARLVAVDEEAAEQRALTHALTRERDNAQRLAGELRDNNANLVHKLNEVDIPEIVRARRDAHMTGRGFIEIRAAGGGRYQSKAIDPKSVTVRDR